MDTKNDYIEKTIKQFLKVAHKYALVEELPIRVDDKTEITTKEAHIIQAIGRQENVNVTSLAISFGISKSASSQMITKLEKKGFVDKTQSLHSNKEYVLSLTEFGWIAYNAHEIFHGEDFKRLVNCLASFSLEQIGAISVFFGAMEEIVEQRLSDDT